MAFSATTDIFSDEVVSAKDLNRQSGRILDVALERPVTITRNSQAFALLPRQDVTTLIQAVKVGRLAFEVTGIAYRLIQGEVVDSENPYAWLGTFDADDLKDFVEEVRSIVHQFEDSPQAWKEIDALIYEWNESALVISSGVLSQIEFQWPLSTSLDSQML